MVDLKAAAVFGNRQPIDLETVTWRPLDTDSHRDGIVPWVPRCAKAGTSRARTTTRRAWCKPSMRTGRRLSGVHDSASRRIRQRHVVERLVGGEREYRCLEPDLGGRTTWSAYLLVETPSPDFYGGHRPGNNLFADSIVAVDEDGTAPLALPAGASLTLELRCLGRTDFADITVGGRPIKAVLVMTKAAMICLRSTDGALCGPSKSGRFQRATCRVSGMPRRSPFPTRPAWARGQGVVEDALIDFTPELRAQAARNMTRYRMGPIFTPPVVSAVQGHLAASVHLAA